MFQRSKYVIQSISNLLKNPNSLMNLSDRLSDMKMLLQDSASWAERSAFRASVLVRMGSWFFVTNAMDAALARHAGLWIYPSNRPDPEFAAQGHVQVEYDKVWVVYSWLTKQSNCNVELVLRGFTNQPFAKFPVIIEFRAHESALLVPCFDFW